MKKLSIFHENKEQMIETGVVQHLIRFMDVSVSMFRRGGVFA